MYFEDKNNIASEIAGPNQVSAKWMRMDHWLEESDVDVSN